MLNEADLVQRYPDLLGGDVEPELVRLVGDLDDASAAYRALEPPAALLAAIDQLTSDHANEQQPRILVPRGFASSNQPPAQSGHSTGKPRHLRPNLAQKRWLRQSTEMAAGILALVLFAGLFVTLLSRTGSLSGTAEPGTQPVLATPNASPGPPQSALDYDPGVQRAYDAGLGKKLDLAQSAGDFKVSIEWAYAQDHWIYVYYTITAPPGKAFKAIDLWKLKVTDDEGNILSQRGEMAAGSPNVSRNYVVKFDASDISAPSGIATLHLQSPAVWGFVPGNPSGTATSLVFPHDPDGLPQSESECPPNYPVCSFNVPGPFSFDFTVPYKPEPQASTPLVATRVTLEQATEQVRAFLGEPDTELTGKPIDTATADSEENIFYPPRPNAKLWVLTHKWKNGEDTDTFIVDADTDEILKAVIPSRAGDDPSQQPISDSDAAARAEEFAKTHFTGFAQLTRVEDDSVIAEDQYLIGQYEPRIAQAPVTFHWRLRSPSSDVWLPALVSVGIDSKSGKVVRYVAHPVGDQSEPKEPLINRERAIQIALSEAGKEPQNIDVSISNVELKTELSNKGENRLYWSVELTGAAPATPGAGQVGGYDIDAMTGEIQGTRMMVGDETPTADSTGPPA